MPAPALYGELAAWWPLFSNPDDYEHEAERIRSQLESAADIPPSTLLELGAGGGNNAWFLQRSYAVTLVDRSEAMLAVSRALNRDCEHLRADMLTMRLARTFSRVLVHDAVSYLCAREQLQALSATIDAHLAIGGSALLVPDFVRETFSERIRQGGGDDDRRSLRFLEWLHRPVPTASWYAGEYSFIMRVRGEDTTFHGETHRFGLFAQDEWLRVLSEAGLAARATPTGDGRIAFLLEKRG